MEKLTSHEVAALQLQINKLKFVINTQQTSFSEFTGLINGFNLQRGNAAIHLLDIELSIKYSKSHLETLQNLLNEQ